MSHAFERELQPGQVIAERYRLEAPIGRGAMGDVWRALHVRLESPLAIKFSSASIASDPDMIERFMREARSAAAVRSSHVVQIFDYGVDAGLPYIAMELLVGETLDERLAARGALGPQELDKVFGEVARAVSVAHELGVVHRDIKPANIFIAREGEREVTKVLDFGIAKLIARQLEAPLGSGTHTGIILGTPNYMSPEQARGHRNVDHRTDIWSLGVLAFECLTGRQPFESNALGDLVVKICTAEPSAPSALAAVPVAFDAWFNRSVDKDPDARFQSASEMAEALHALLAAEGLAADSRPRSAPARDEPAQVAGAVLPTGQLELLATGSTPSPRLPASVSSAIAGATSKAPASASERLPERRPPGWRRSKLALAAIPLGMLGVVLAASPWKPPEGAPAGRVAAVPTPSPPASNAPAPSIPAPSAPREPVATSAPAAPAAPAPTAAMPRRRSSLLAVPRVTPRASRPAASSHRAAKTPRTAPAAPPVPPTADPYADRL